MQGSEIRRGFTLPAVLGVTGVVTLIFIVAMTALASLAAEAASARARIGFLQRALTAEATLGYMVATQPFSRQGIAIGGQRVQTEFDIGLDGLGAPANPVILDGRSYVMDGAGDLDVSLRDEAGMINLALLDEGQRNRLAQALGLTGLNGAALQALYADYVDADDLTSPNGAERAIYPQGGPANRFLRRPSEWLSILNLRARVDPALWRALRPDIATDAQVSAINVNTASPAALQVLFGGTQQQAEAAVRARQTASFLSLNDYTAASGVAAPLADERSYAFPSGRVAYRFRDRRSPWTYRGRMTVSPTGLERPLWIDQTELTEAPGRAVADTTDATRFPDAPD